MKKTKFHFSGVAGAGMNPLARMMAYRDYVVQGSDRGIDNGSNKDLLKIFNEENINILPQDGTAIDSTIDKFIYSAAVESDTPEMLAAKKAGIKTISRPKFLAEILSTSNPSVAISGTSGKSSVTGLIAWILKENKKNAGVISGAPLVSNGETHMGHFSPSKENEPLIIEACESDGTLVNYAPSIGVIHNISRDHSELDSLIKQFTTFANNCDLLFINNDCKTAKTIKAKNTITYGIDNSSDIKLEIVRTGPYRAQGTLLFGNEEVFIDLPQPGEYNLSNAAIAIIICGKLGVSKEDAAKAISTFPGIARRFQDYGRNESGIRVIDDYAHNGEKIKAAITATQESCERLVAIFQPHGFAPARFLREELKTMLPEILRPQDIFCYGEIFYAGGTVAKDISSKMLADDLQDTKQVFYADKHLDILDWCSEKAIPNDTILLMGARDPSLPKLAKAIYESL